MTVPPPREAHPHPGPPPERPERPEGAPGGPPPPSATGGWAPPAAGTALPPAPAPPTEAGRRDGDDPGGSEQLPPWPGWIAPAALLCAFGAAIVVGVALAIVLAAGRGRVGDSPPGFVIAATFFQDAALIGSALLFARMQGRGVRPADFGLRRFRVPPALGWIVLGFLAQLTFTAVWTSLVGSPAERDTLQRQLGADPGTVAFGAFVVLVTVVAPIAEEFFFRGFFFTALRRWSGPWVGAALTGLVFGGIHVGSAATVSLVPLAFFGFVLCLLRWRTRALYPCIVLHAVNNCLAVGVDKDLSWGWEIVALIVAANLVIAVLVLPFVLRREAPAAGA